MSPARKTRRLSSRRCSAFMALPFCCCRRGFAAASAAPPRRRGSWAPARCCPSPLRAKSCCRRCANRSRIAMDRPRLGALRERFAAKLQESAALRYALAPACIGLCVLLNISVLGPFLHPTALFLAGIVAAAWFGGAGPGFLAALLATLVLPQLITMSYPLTAGFFDLPRFLAFGLTAAAVGWGTTSRRRAEEAELRQSEERYARAMQASNDGL